MTLSESWRRMLVTQPPLRHVRLERNTHSNIKSTNALAFHAFPHGDGLRMSTLYAIAHDFVLDRDDSFAFRQKSHDHDMCKACSTTDGQGFKIDPRAGDVAVILVQSFSSVFETLSDAEHAVMLRHEEFALGAGDKVFEGLNKMLGSVDDKRTLAVQALRVGRMLA